MDNSPNILNRGDIITMLKGQMIRLPPVIDIWILTGILYRSI